MLISTRRRWRRGKRRTHTDGEKIGFLTDSRMPLSLICHTYMNVTCHLPHMCDQKFTYSFIPLNSLFLLFFCYSQEEMSTLGRRCYIARIGKNCKPNHSFPLAIFYIRYQEIIYCDGNCMTSQCYRYER
jgi:hypothetical protein